MPLTDQETTQALHALYAIFPEDLHIVRLFIRDLQKHGKNREAREIALSTARHMVSHGRASGAIGFLELCRQLGSGNDAEIEALFSLAQFSGEPAGITPEEGRSFVLIEQLSDQEALDFLRHGRLRRVNKGDKVVRQGEVEDIFHLILEGSMRVEMKTDDKQHIDLGEIKAGRFFGEVACVYHLPRSATVVATEPGLLLEFTSLTIRQLMGRSPLAGDALLRVIRERMIDAMLHKHPAMDQLLENDRRWVIETSELLEFRSNKTIVRQPEMGKHWYIMVHGQAETRILRASGEVVAAPLPVGAIFGNLHPSIAIPPGSEVVAMEHCLVCRAPEEIFRSFLSVYDGFDRWIRRQGDTRTKQWKELVAGRSTAAAK